jgi:hypothetical protein
VAEESILFRDNQLTARAVCLTVAFGDEMAKKRTQQNSLNSQQSAAEFFSEHQQIAGFDNVLFSLLSFVILSSHFLPSSF